MKPSTLLRLKIGAGIAAGALTVVSGIYAAGAAHGDAMAEIDRIRDRIDRLERLPERVDRMADRLVRIEASVEAIRIHFAIPAPGARP